MLQRTALQEHEVEVRGVVGALGGELATETGELRPVLVGDRAHAIDRALQHLGHEHATATDQVADRRVGVAACHEVVRHDGHDVIVAEPAATRSGSSIP